MCKFGKNWNWNYWIGCSDSISVVSPAFPDLFCPLPTSVVRCVLCVEEIRSFRTNDTIRRDTKLECGRNTIKERDSYLLLTRKLNDLPVAATVDELVTTQ